MTMELRILNLSLLDARIVVLCNSKYDHKVLLLLGRNCMTPFYND